MNVEVLAAQEVLLDFLSSFRIVLEKIPVRAQAKEPLWDWAWKVLQEVQSAKSPEALVEAHQELHDLGNAVAGLRIRAELKHNKRNCVL